MEQFAARDLKAETTEILQPSEIHYADPKREKIKMLMFYLATARQASVSKAVLDSYSKGLSGFDLQDIEAAVGIIGRSEREEGKTAMPSLGDMVKACQGAAGRRHEAIAQEKRMQFDAYAAAHPEKFFSFKELMEDMQMQRDACEVAFGPDWRTRAEYKPVYDAQGHWLRGGLGDVYGSAMEAR